MAFFGIRLAGVSLGLTILAGLALGGPIVVWKDDSGQVTPGTASNVALLSELAARVQGVRVWVTVRAAYDPQVETGTPEYRTQQARIAAAKRDVIQRLKARSSFTRSIEHPTLGPYFAVEVDRAGMQELIRNPVVTRVFGPA